MRRNGGRAGSSPAAVAGDARTRGDEGTGAVQPALVALLAALLVPGLLLGWPGPAAAAPAAPAEGGEVLLEGFVGDGVYLRELRDAGPVTSVVIEAQPGSPVQLVPVLSGERIDGGLESVSSMCRRAGGVVCVNANFSVCRRCSHPFGGVVRNGRLLRTPTPLQDQVSVVDGRLTVEPWRWWAGLVALDGGPHADVEVGGVNVGLGADDVVVYTPEYGATTRAAPDAYELVVRTPPLQTGAGVRQQAELLRVHTGGGAPIPADGAVISARGAGADRLWAFVEHHRSSLVELITITPDGLQQSFAGHPILLRNGERRHLEPDDGKVVNRHPRTLLAWNDAGSTWLVVVDGRQHGSRGVTLHEATDMVLGLGATHAVNLDGGGSSTMVTTCPSPSGLCVRNRPSDGRERNVSIGLALVGGAPVAARAVEEPAPPTTAPPAPTTTVAPPTTTAAPASTSATTTTTSTTTTVPRRPTIDRDPLPLPVERWEAVPLDDEQALDAPLAVPAVVAAPDPRSTAVGHPMHALAAAGLLLVVAGALATFAPARLRRPTLEDPPRWRRR